MKIAFLNLYSGVNNRGAETFAHELARRLGKNHEVKFYRGADYNLKVVQSEHNSRNLLKRFFLDGANLSVLQFSWKIFPILRREKYDWVIPINGFWQVLLCKLLPSKILITGHSGPGWDERWNLYLKPDVFVATTEPTEKWAKRTCPWTKIVTIPYGIDMGLFAKAKPVKINLPRPVILCDAAAVEYKRIDLAIKAVAKLKKASLLHLGAGPLLPSIQALGRGLLGNRFFSTAVAYKEIPNYFAACDVVTLPSMSQENSPIVFLEAMAAGKPVVTTDAPRSRWTLGPAALYVDPRNLDEYAQALVKSEKLDRELIASQAQKFSWDKIAAQYENLIESN
ncbi:MAG: glycosyltransferase family 4 protein [Patescibacteria group bacterium]|nr:glycosyltransferase family 4 protein [Patescibacteria group bacterium]MCL5431692.1 glycosyltransferase family 4 protein [Patescibacteria group bacterium]